jgi:hypothetical protein
VQAPKAAEVAPKAAEQQAVEQQAVEVAPNAVEKQAVEVAPKAVEQQALTSAKPVAVASGTSALGLWRQAIGQHKDKNYLTKMKQQLADNIAKVGYYQTQVSEAEAVVKEATEKVESDPASRLDKTELRKATRNLKERKEKLTNWQTRVTYLEAKVGNLQLEMGQ